MLIMSKKKRSKDSKSLFNQIMEIYFSMHYCCFRMPRFNY